MIGCWGEMREKADGFTNNMKLEIREEKIIIKKAA